MTAMFAFAAAETVPTAPVASTPVTENVALPVKDNTPDDPTSCKRLLQLLLYLR